MATRSKNGHNGALLEVSSASLLDDIVPLQNKAKPAVQHEQIHPKHEQYENQTEILMQLDNSLAEAGRNIVYKQLQKLEKAKKSVQEQQDPEGIHAMRVASRRLRTALKILQETVDDPKMIAYYRKGLHKITDKLSQVRDADVRIEHLAGYSKAHPEQSEGLEASVQSLQEERDKAMVSFNKTLHKHKIQHLLHDLEEFSKQVADTSLPFQKDPAEVLPTLVRHFVGSQIWQGYEGVLAYETVLAEPQKVAILTLHRLRIAFKHLRYTLEFFQDALPATAKSLVEQLTEMQNYLGDLHDHDVAVSEYDQQLAEHPNNTALRTYRDERAIQRDQMQHDFPQKWAKINSPLFRQKLSSLLK